MERVETRDEVIAAVHTVRETYAARFNYDVAALFRHAREQAQKSEREVVQRQPKLIEGLARTAGQ